jgi:integrase
LKPSNRTPRSGREWHLWIRQIKRSQLWRAIFKLAQRYGPIQGRANVAELAERLKVSNEENEDEEVRPEQGYSEEELQRLVEATAPGTLERVLVMLPALTGFRIGEVLGLTWPAVDFKASKIHVRLNLVDESKEKGRASTSRA